MKEEYDADEVTKIEMEEEHILLSFKEVLCVQKC
jgi:hypothetical protein